jgi:large subunit ribosomal protein L10
MHPAKATIVEDLQAKLNASSFLFVADYTGLRVGQFTELRNRSGTLELAVTSSKTLLLKRAAVDAGCPNSGDFRQSAIIVGDRDVFAAAKVLKTFAAEFQKPRVKLGIVDKIVISTEQTQTTADLPSQVLLATFPGAPNAPASKLVRVLNEPASALARVLKAKAEKESTA